MTFWLIHLKVLRALNEAFVRSALEFLDYEESTRLALGPVGPATYAHYKADPNPQPANLQLQSPQAPRHYGIGFWRD